jgi:hypothetical protein
VETVLLRFGVWFGVFVVDRFAPVLLPQEPGQSPEPVQVPGEPPELQVPGELSELVQVPGQPPELVQVPGQPPELVQSGELQSLGELQMQTQSLGELQMQQRALSQVARGTPNYYYMCPHRLPSIPHPCDPMLMAGYLVAASSETAATLAAHQNPTSDVPCGLQGNPSSD